MRYIIGIDLGTTNSALSFVDTEKSFFSIHSFAIPQLASGGRVEALPTLPSYGYLASSGEFSKGALRLPWKEDRGETSCFVGQYAKELGAKVPTRLVQSAKSWLSQVSANRKDRILPLEAQDPSCRLSPLEASSKYLEHLKEAWNATHAKGDPALELQEQDIILTVPASFDEVARALTLEAAKLAGIEKVTLLEEPTAAFYHWISLHEKKFDQQFEAGETILVCDVGGGTTDFSLIEVQKDQGSVQFERIAVGKHLLLGGDNLDHALAHYAEQKLINNGHAPLESFEWLQLLAAAREAKEALLDPQKTFSDHYTLVIQGRGSLVVKGSSCVTLERQEVEKLLVEGFFGVYPIQEALNHRKAQGLRSVGLPYEDEPSITKQLACFLRQSGLFDHKRRLDYLLFNGGTFHARIFQRAVESCLSQWFPDSQVKRLDGTSLDLAVSKGAAYYGKVRRGLGVLVGGGVPRNYYLKIEVKDSSGLVTEKAMVILSKGSKEGKTVLLSHPFFLRPNHPVAFVLLVSHTRAPDEEGSLLDIDPENMLALPPLQTLFKFGKGQAGSDLVIPVKLKVSVTAVGTLELWLASEASDHQWQLEFQLRSAEGQESWNIAQEGGRKNLIFEKGYLEAAQKSLEALFQQKASFPPNHIMEHLESVIGLEKREWGLAVLRELSQSLMAVSSQRKISKPLEERWWNLTGFFLRPGTGYPLDDFRLKALWKLWLGELKEPKSQEVLIQMLICARRLSSGLNKGQQMQLSSSLIGDLVDKKTGKIALPRKSEHYLYAEKLRALASFERLDVSFKISLGRALIDKIKASASLSRVDLWAIGRLGARHLLYGSLGQVIPQREVVDWIDVLLQKKEAIEESDRLWLMRQLARKSSQRELNLPQESVQKILASFPDCGLEEFLLKEKERTLQEQSELFGEELPSGLCLSVR